MGNFIAQIFDTVVDTTDRQLRVCYRDITILALQKMNKLAKSSSSIY